MKHVKKIVTVTLILVLCVLLYYRYANKEKERTGIEKQTEVSQVDKVLLRDLENDYPATPLEVVKFFTKIQKCYYNENNTESIVEELGNTARKLLDEELLANNPDENYLADLKGEIDSYDKGKRTIENILYDHFNYVRYVEVDGVQCASLNCTYYIKTGKNISTITETYILRKDADGLWKIYGWDLTKNLQDE